MNFRPHPGLSLALATALAGAVPLATPAAAADDTEYVQHCYTTTLTLEEVEAGAVSEFDCYQVPDGTPFEVEAHRGTIVLAVVYDISSTTGAAFQVTGPSCTGGTFVITSGTFWDNKISATYLNCGSAKHWDANNFTGANQLKTGLGYHTITGTMDNATSSIEYA